VSRGIGSVSEILHVAFHVIGKEGLDRLHKFGLVVLDGDDAVAATGDD
jgi:hypothetical protein